LIGKEIESQQKRSGRGKKVKWGGRERRRREEDPTFFGFQPPK